MPTIERRKKINDALKAINKTVANGIRGVCATIKLVNCGINVREGSSGQEKRKQIMLKSSKLMTRVKSKQKKHIRAEISICHTNLLIVLWVQRTFKCRFLALVAAGHYRPIGHKILLDYALYMPFWACNSHTISVKDSAMENEMKMVCPFYYEFPSHSLICSASFVWSNVLRVLKNKTDRDKCKENLVLLLF